MLEQYGHKELVVSTDWQKKDMQMSIYNDKIDYDKIPLETVWNKNRRSGKTRDATKLAVFFSIMNKDCIWRTPVAQQLKMSFKWYRMNPFVDKIKRLDHIIEVGRSPNIDVAVLLPGNCTGIEGNVIFLDEGGWVQKGKVVYEGYRQARPMIAATNFKHIIHFSTPARGTAFKEAWDSVAGIERQLDTTLRVTRTVDDCDWITPEFVESEKLANFDCPWYVKQNYYGEFVVYGGAVFDTPIDINNAPPHIRDHWDATGPNVGGFDFNEPTSGHYMVIGNIFPVEGYTFIREEMIYDNLVDLAEYMAIHPDLNLEIEDGGFNLPFVDDCYQLGIHANYVAWQDIDKQMRVRALQRLPVYIDKLACPLTYRNMQEAAFDETSRLPKLLKTALQHGLDCVLHMMGMSNVGKIYYSGTRAIRRNPFKNRRVVAGANYYNT